MSTTRENSLIACLPRSIWQWRARNLTGSSVYRIQWALGTTKMEEYSSTTVNERQQLQTTEKRNRRSRSNSKYLRSFDTGPCKFHYRSCSRRGDIEDESFHFINTWRSKPTVCTDGRFHSSRWNPDRLNIDQVWVQLTPMLLRTGRFRGKVPFRQCISIKNRNANEKFDHIWLIT